MRKGPAEGVGIARGCYGRGGRDWWTIGGCACSED